MIRAVKLARKLWKMTVRYMKANVQHLTTSLRGSFCLAFHKSFTNHSVAQQLCAKDGGQIINVDTTERYDLVLKNATSVGIHIQGERRVAGGPFFDDAGKSPEDRPFFKWASGEPDNTSNELYLAIYSTGVYDVSGTIGCYVFCEIRQ